MDLITPDTPGLFFVSLAIGVVVGLTGMGGGALMTPALIFLGIPPTAAVSNDLVAAAVNKSVAAGVHLRQGTPHKKIALLLIAGSVPAALFGSWLVHQIGAGGKDVEGFLRTLIGVMLLITASSSFLRAYLELRAYAKGIEAPSEENVAPRAALTLLVGVIGGLIVGLSSVGSGTLIMVSLLLLYPTLAINRVVGTDLVQAVPLVLSAAIGHVLVTGVDLAVLVPLIVGGTPGAYIGARIAGHVSEGLVRRGIVIVLTLTGLLLLKVPATLVGIIGAGLMILGPLAWAGIRLWTGLPARVPPEDRGRRSALEKE